MSSPGEGFSSPVLPTFPGGFAASRANSTFLGKTVLGLQGSEPGSEPGSSPAGV